MGQNFLIPHPNIPTADIGLPKLKEVTVKNNENFLALDRLVQEFNVRFADTDKRIASMAHDHPYAPEQHGHQLADIDGLIAALEQKAPLVHTHPEYLTEIPPHVHTEEEVDGLLADLASKANLQHVHNMSDVNGLLDALGLKADDSYVNWLESQMAKLTKTETPLVDGHGEQGEGNVGSSTKAARADHQHPINVNTDGDTTKLKRDGNATGGNPSFGSLVSYARTDHSHPLNEPNATEQTQESVLAALLPDGSNDGLPYLGGGGWYAPLQHSHKTNFRTSGTPTDISTTAGAEGMAKEYAHADHTHKLPKIEQSHVNGLEGDLDNLDGRVTTLEGKFPQTGFVKQVAGVTPDGSGNVVMASLVAALRGTTAGTLAEGNHAHTHDKITDFDDSVQALIDEDLEGYAKKTDFPVDETTGIPTDDNIFQHSHSADQVVVVGGTTERRLDSYFETNNDLDGAQVRFSTTGKWVKTNATTGRLETPTEQPIAEDGDSADGELMAMSVNGDARSLTGSGISIPTEAPETNKFLAHKTDGNFDWLEALAAGVKTTPDPTKGVSAHPDYYDYPDKQAHPQDPAIVFPDWQRYYDMPGDDHAPPARLTGADNVTPVGWERGKTAYKNGHAVDADHPAVGLSMTVITHMRQITVSGTAKYQAMFSRMDFDENGLLVRVVPCTNWYTMM